MSFFIVISPTHADPMYKQIADQVKDAIASGSLQPMEKLPSIREMADELKISVITVKRAYQDLENGGLIHTRAGLGSFISELDEAQLRREKMEEIREDIRRILSVGQRFHISADDVIAMVKQEAAGSHTRNHGTKRSKRKGR